MEAPFGAGERLVFRGPDMTLMHALATTGTLQAISPIAGGTHFGVVWAVVQRRASHRGPETWT